MLRNADDVRRSPSIDSCFSNIIDDYFCLLCIEDIHRWVAYWVWLPPCKHKFPSRILDAKHYFCKCKTRGLKKKSVIIGHHIIWCSLQGEGIPWKDRITAAWRQLMHSYSCKCSNVLPTPTQPSSAIRLPWSPFFGIISVTKHWCMRTSVSCNARCPAPATVAMSARVHFMWQIL